MVVGLVEQRRGVDRVFHALADATRRDIVVRTLQAEHSVSALARLYPMSFAAVQKHVAVLEGAGLVTKRRHGREQLVTGNVDTVRRTSRLLDDLEAVWRARIDRFGEILAEDS
jgi:DNA-binding transcriptional ArsR family regulator